MGAQRTARVVLDLEAGEPISGVISGPGGPPQSFRGWLELTVVLERVRASDRESPAGDGDRASGRRPSAKEHA
ncbi:MAG: hypothetical protein ABSC56_06765 [Solirubrobacteraceae bacterium]|jgi:hypothetical protein